MHKLLKFKRHIVIIILTILFLTPTLPVFAHDAVFLQTVLDTKAKRYVSTVVTDKPGFSNEKKHLEAQLGDFRTDALDLTSEVGDPLSPFTGKTISEFLEIETVSVNGKNTVIEPASERKSMIFTFPSKEEKGFLWFGGKNHATAEDIDRAFYIANELTSSLNSLLSFVNNGKAFTDWEHLVKTSILIRPNSAEQSTVIVPGPNNTKFKITYDKDIDQDDPEALKKGYLKGRAIKLADNGEDEGEPFVFIYAIAKGYIPVLGQNEAYIRPSQEPYDFAKEKDDTAWITIHHLALQANYANTVGVNFDSGTPVESLNKFQEIIRDFLLDILYGLLNVLGLYTVEELVYNKGIRGSSFNDGLMSTQWWDVVMRYHLIFQALAWTLLAGAIIKILIQINFSTVNPTIRMHLYETFEKLFIVGIFLSAIIPIVRLFATLNNSVVDIFATEVDLSTTGRMATHGGFIPGIIVEFFYFALTFYVNFVYIMRSIMLALLIASAPFFIVTMAFSWRGKGLFYGWFKELIANLFLQGFHAFAFAFIYNIQASGRGIESMVAMASLIPLTEFFRTLIFGSAGAGAISIGKSLGQVGTSMARGAVSGAIGKANLSMLEKMGADSFDGEKFGERSSSGSRTASSGGNALQVASAKLKERSKQSFQKAKEDGKHSESTFGISRGPDGELSFNKGQAGAMLSGIGQNLGSTAMSAGAVSGQMLGGLADVAEGISFGNQQQALQGASTIGKELGSSAYSVGSTGAILSTQAVGNVGKSVDNKFNKGRLQKDADNLKYKARNFFSGGSYHIGTEENPDGTSSYILDNNLMSRQTGISDMSMFKQNGKNFLNTTLDMNKADLGTAEEPTEFGRNFAHMMHLSQTEEGRDILKQDYGIEEIRNFGNGKFQILGNETFMQNQGILNVEKTPSNNYTKITKAPGSGAGVQVMPRIKAEAVNNYNKEVLDYSYYIGGVNENKEYTEGVARAPLNTRSTANINTQSSVPRSSENKSSNERESYEDVANKGLEEGINEANNIKS